MGHRLRSLGGIDNYRNAKLGPEGRDKLKGNGVRFKRKCTKRGSETRKVRRILSSRLGDKYDRLELRELTNARARNCSCNSRNADSFVKVCLEMPRGAHVAFGSCLQLPSGTRPDNGWTEVVVGRMFMNEEGVSGGGDDLSHLITSTKRRAKSTCRWLPFSGDTRRWRRGPMTIGFHRETEHTAIVRCEDFGRDAIPGIEYLESLARYARCLACI